MYIKEEYRKIIEETVRESKYFPQNEHLFDEFCKNVYKKTYLILGTKQNAELKEYLKGVVHKVIIGVLKKYAYEKYITQSPKEYHTIKKALHDEETKLTDYNARAVYDAKTTTAFDDYNAVPDPSLFIKEKDLTRDFMKKAASAIYETHQQMPNRLYFQIFYYKYFKQIPQAQVAKRLGITQGELSKRLIELIQILKGFKINFE